jgi:hypothetical protein
MEDVSAADPSLEPPRDAVKKAKPGQKAPPSRRPFARLLEGWELGTITVGLVLAAALVAVPRAAAPGLFPVPLVDVAEARAARERLATLADRAERDGLAFEARAVGDGVRRLGQALARGAGDREHLNRLIKERVQAALAAKQDDALLRLRAVQARLFVSAVRGHVWGGPSSDDLAALGGDFVAHAKRSGWLGPEGCVASDDELTTLFMLRWTEQTGLRADRRFAPTLGEWRRYFRFLLLHPEAAEGAETPSRERARQRLRYVEALARHDTEYPLGLARGSLFGELGLMPESARALTEHLARPRSHEWNLRARNYLLFAASGHDAELAEDSPLDTP